MQTMPPETPEAREAVEAFVENVKALDYEGEPSLDEIERLTAFGDAVLGPISGLFVESVEYSIRYWAARVLGRIDSECTLTFLESLISGADSYNRYAAFHGLAESPSERAMDSIIQGLLNEDDYYEHYECYGLHHRDFSLLMQRIPALLEQSSYHRCFAAKILAGFSNAEADAILLRLLNDETLRVATAAAWGLAQHQGPAFAAAFLAHLRRREEPERFYFFGTLRDYCVAPETAEDILRYAMELVRASSEDDVLRANAVYLISSVSSFLPMEGVYAELVELLREEWASHKEATELGAALRDCLCHEQSGVLLLTSLLSGEEPSFSEFLADGLRWGRERVIEPISRLIESTQDHFVKQLAIQVLGKTNVPEATVPLLSLLLAPPEDCGPVINQAMLEHRAWDPEQLLPLLHHENPHIRGQIIRFLPAPQTCGDEQNQRILNALMACLESENASLVREASAALVMRESAPPKAALLVLSLHDQELQRKAAASLIAQGSLVLRDLEEALFDDDYRVRAQVAQILGAIGDSAAEDSLIVALSDAVPEVQENVIIALSQIKSQSAAAPLIKMLYHSSWERKLKATKALVKMGQVAVEPLLEALSSYDIDVRMQAASALGGIGAVEAVGPLLPLIFHDNTSLRKKAFAALSLIGVQLDAQEFIAVLRSVLGNEPTQHKQDALVDLLSLMSFDDQTSIILDYIKQHLQSTWPKEVGLGVIRRINRKLRKIAPESFDYSI